MPFGSLRSMALITRATSCVPGPPMAVESASLANSGSLPSSWPFSLPAVLGSFTLEVNFVRDSSPVASNEMRYSPIGWFAGTWILRPAMNLPALDLMAPAVFSSEPLGLRTDVSVASPPANLNLKEISAPPEASTVKVYRPSPTGSGSFSFDFGGVPCLTARVYVAGSPSGMTRSGTRTRTFHGPTWSSV